MISRRSFLKVIGLAPAVPALAVLAPKAAAIPAYELVVGEMFPFEYASGGLVTGCTALVGEVGPELLAVPSMVSGSMHEGLIIRQLVERQASLAETASLAVDVVDHDETDIGSGPAFDNPDDLIAYLDAGA